MTTKIGLVLAGGGAKGAYQAGAVKYLAEVDFVPQVIAGTSIGALNGAILASHLSFKFAANRMWELWTELGQSDIIKSQIGKYLSQMLRSFKLSQNSQSLFDSTPIETFLRHTVDPQQLRTGIELWVAAFPSAHCSHQIYKPSTLGKDVLRAKFGQTADFFHIQLAKTDEEIYQTLLASAAFPLAFIPRKVDGIDYIDGWLGDNVPLKALVKRGCTHAVIIHLENGSLWNRYDFPNQVVVEIRPTETINKNNTAILGDLTSFLDFSPERIQYLQKCGYQDAKRCLDPLLKTLFIEKARKENCNQLQVATQTLIDDPPVS